MGTPIDKLEQLARAASPGPWLWGSPRDAAHPDMRVLYPISGLPILWLHGESLTVTLGSNTDYIAAVDPTTVLELVAEVRRLRGVEAQVKALNAMVGELRGLVLEMILTRAIAAGPLTPG